ISMSLRRLDYLSNRSYDLLERRDLGDQLLAPQWRQRVISCAPPLFRLTPFRDHPTFEEHPLERGIQGAFLNLQHVVGCLLDVEGDPVAMHRSQTGERL